MENRRIFFSRKGAKVHKERKGKKISLRSLREKIQRSVLN